MLEYKYLMGTMSVSLFNTRVDVKTRLEKATALGVQSEQ